MGAQGAASAAFLGRREALGGAEQSGPTARFRHLYLQFGKLIRAHCRRLLADSAAAEDAAQETFLRVYRHLDSAPSNEEALRWIYRIATNYCLNVLRDRQRAPVLMAVIDIQGDPAEDWIADRDLARKLALGAPDQIAEAARLHHVDGLNQADVAAVLGISRRTVVNHLAAFRHHVVQFAAHEAGCSVPPIRSAPREHRSTKPLPLKSPLHALLAAARASAAPPNRGRTRRIRRPVGEIRLSSPQNR